MGSDVGFLAAWLPINVVHHFRHRLSLVNGFCCPCRQAQIAPSCIRKGMAVIGHEQVAAERDGAGRFVVNGGPLRRLLAMMSPSFNLAPKSAGKAWQKTTAAPLSTDLPSCVVTVLSCGATLLPSLLGNGKLIEALLKARR